MYVEGGGDNSTSKRQLRQGFHQFLRTVIEAAQGKHIRFQLVMCGPRNAAFENFKQGVKDNPSSYCLLLVDAENAVLTTPWHHLRARDAWPVPALSDDHCHLMAQAMESWLVADIGALSRYYGQGFNAKAIPLNDDVEQLTKADLMEALIHATQNTQKGRYHKIKHACDLLGKVNPTTVRAKARHCDRLVASLDELIRTS